MTIDNNKLIKALAKLSPDEIQEILQNQEKTNLFKASIDKLDAIDIHAKEHPSVRWKEQQKNIVSFLNEHYPLVADWWDGWVVDFEFAVSSLGYDTLIVTLKRVDGEQKILRMLLTIL